MTASDVQMAKELVTKLDAESFVTEVYHAHDPRPNLEDVSSRVIYVDGKVSHRRVARRRWAKTVVIEVVAMEPQTETGKLTETESETEKDDWLNFIDDDLVGFLQDTTLGGKRAMSIEIPTRLNSQMLSQHALFSTTLQMKFEGI